MKRVIKVIALKVASATGKMITFLLNHDVFLKIYNKMYESSPHLLVRQYVKFIELPDRNRIWLIKLENGKVVKTYLKQGDLKSKQFALSYKWHSPSLNFTEKILSEYYHLNVPWIDIGSNLGLRSLIALSENRPVYFLEPNTELNAINRERCELNNFQNTTFIEAGVSDKKGMAKFYIDSTSYNSSLDERISDTNRIEEEVMIQTDTLDHLFRDKLNDYETACIKMDVEGHELHALKGAEEVINKWEPTMMIEVNMSSGNHEAFLNFVKKWDYEVYQIKKFSSGNYYKKITVSTEPFIDDIESNDFLLLKDQSLKKIIDKYAVSVPKIKN